MLCLYRGIQDGVLAKVGQLCDIIAWEREKVGVSVGIRCVGRVEIDGEPNMGIAY